MAMRAAEVIKTPYVDRQITELSQTYPAIGAAVNDFCEALRLDYILPFQKVTDDQKNVYVHRIDYPPLGKSGHGLFLAVFHATPSTPSMTVPYRTYTILSVTVRQRAIKRAN